MGKSVDKTGWNPGQRLERTLYELNMTKADLSRETGISYETIARMCREPRHGSLDSRARIADQFGMTVTELTGV